MYFFQEVYPRELFPWNSYSQETEKKKKYSWLRVHTSHVVKKKCDEFFFNRSTCCAKKYV